MVFIKNSNFFYFLQEIQKREINSEIGITVIICLDSNKTIIILS